jgi:hypothetical protein
VLAGRVVGSADASDRFLWDFRRTLADMYADEFYATMSDELHKRGMQDYAEASGVALEIPEDTLLNKSKIDIPMAEFWVRALHPESMYYVDVRGAASAAHVYGKPIVATESFTGGGYESPFTLKKIADYWFAQGVNRLVFHTSAEQPLDTQPGNTMVGTHINRNITWAEQARPFMDYVARISYMLQQGSPVADLAYLLPEGVPSTMPFWGSGLLPAPPAGYDYDHLNTDILLHHTSVDQQGRIHLDTGMSYCLLILPPTRQMTPEVLRKLHELVDAGAIILGPRPTASPSLANYPAADDEVRALAADLWGDTDGVTNNEHHLGKGIVFSGLTLSDLLARLQIAPDVISTVASDQTPVWVHHHLPDGDAYFVVNQTDLPRQVSLRVRATGNNVQVWRPMDGSATAALANPGALVESLTGNRQSGIQPAIYKQDSGFTTVQLDLAARESVFIVLRDQGRRLETASAITAESTDISKHAWILIFPPHLGAPDHIQIDRPTFWTQSTNPGVKYFSGTATYSTTFTVPASVTHAKRVFLHMDDVRDIAQVSVNGHAAGLVWAPPYDVDITSLLRAGANKLDISVTNEWTNRVMGDRTLQPGQRVLDGPLPPQFGPPVALPDSGITGRVALFIETGPSTSY